MLEQFAVRDTYFTDSRTFEVIGHSVCIDDETLADAISALPVDRRDIILLSYFLDMSDAEIANVLNMVRRSCLLYTSLSSQLCRLIQSSLHERSREYTHKS